MKHWSDIYPHKIYANVLLNENDEIINWKTVNYYWKSPQEAKMTYEHFKNIKSLKVCYKEFEVFNDDEHNDVFTTKAIEWYKNFLVAKNNVGVPPYSNLGNKNLPF